MTAAGQSASARGRSEQRRAYQKAYRAANAAKLSLLEKEWRKRNAEHVKEGNARRGAQWYLENKDRLKPLRKEWARRAAPERAPIVAKYSADRRARKATAVPSWADKSKTEALYREARMLTTLTGTPWHVDHVVPLNSPIVCGLHWHGNLQVIPAIVNIVKNNRTWPDAP